MYRNYKTFTLILLLAVVAASHVIAKPVTQETARQVSINSGRTMGMDKDSRIAEEVYPAPIVGANVAWIVEFKGKGFAIAGGDDLLLPVYYYSEEGKFDPEHPGLQVILHEMAERLAAINRLDQSKRNEIALARETSWLEAISGAMPKAAPNFLSPLMSSTWGQGQPFNDDCPWWAGDQTVVGCVATAMAQIMYYWRHPATGQGSQDAYSTSTHGINIPSTNFGATTYDWANMTDAGDDGTAAGGDPSPAQVAAMARLSYHAGVAVEMNYGNGVVDNGSFASTSDVDNALVDHFRYRSSAQYKSLVVFEVLNELEYLRPIQIRGEGPPGGHSWVVDGYNYSGDDTRLHMNMGWDSESDGWYRVDSIPLGLNDDKHIVRYIAPNNVYFCANYGNCNSGTPDCMYGSFSTAIWRIPEGRTLIVRAGSNHPGSFTVDKPMTIRGINVTIGE